MQGESKKSSFVSDMTQGNEELGCNKMAIFSCETPGMQKFSQNLP